VTAQSTGHAAAETLSPPPSGVLQIWSDLLCPFAHVLMHGLRRTRSEHPELANVRIEHRAFPLELFNGPHPRRGTDTEAVGLGQIEPDAGFRVWTSGSDSYPNTVLLAAEAVIAAGAQGRRAAEELDAALRRAFWTDSRSIAHRAVILEFASDVAAENPAAGLDVDALSEAIDDGRYRRRLFDDYRIAGTDLVPGSPTVVLPDGAVLFNPGITVHWAGPWAAGFPVVDDYQPGVHRELLERAAG
jgi:predicted DsbA family dithiol-disulfide isomerase